MKIIGDWLRGIIKEELGADKASEKTVEGLRKQIHTLKEELEDLRLQKKMEQKEIEHLVKMKEEKQAIELEKEGIELEKGYQKKEMELQTQYHEKVLKHLDETKREFQALYKEILTRLPNVNMEIKKS